MNTELGETQQKIIEMTDAMRDLLLYKNKKYGDSALKPKRIFYKGTTLSSILIRLDDKLSRVMESNDKLPRINDVADIIADIPYNIGKNAYGSNPRWYIGGDMGNREGNK